MQDAISIFTTTQVMMTTSFEVYHYREPYFKPLDFHTHDFYEAYLFLDGNVTYYIEEHAYDLFPGDLLLIPPGRMHRPVLTDNAAVYERMVLWLNTGFLRSLEGGEPLLQELGRFNGKSGYLVHFADEDLSFIQTLLVRLSGAQKRRDPLAHSEQKALISLFLSLLCRQAEQTAVTSAKPSALIPKVIRYLNAHFVEPLTLDSICTEFFISKFHLTRKFKEYTNTTIYDYILSKRIGLARRLIRQGATAAAAAEACGFSDYSSFYKIFAAKTGMTPADFKSLCATSSTPSVVGPVHSREKA